MNQILHEKILQDCGVTDQTITPQHRDELDEQGFTIFYDVIDDEWLQQLRQRFEYLMKEEGDQAGIEMNPMHGIRRLSDLANKGKEFVRIYMHPIMLAAAAHIIQRPFKIYGFNGHDPLPGHGHQGLHSDVRGPRSETVFQASNSLWMLDDLTAENGATRVVPGSHRYQDYPRECLEDPFAPHPDEVYITAPAGSVAVFNAHLWHGGTENRTSTKRRVIHSAYIAREHPQQLDQRTNLRPETEVRLSEAQRYILDV
ncbi:phytanoyl-CoA dioxygenase family protein [Chloroflexi bacterium TSY]|nr:phytanoyl-CoA dioxygenase family protein [Chloroflexi bacterium TSY]